VRVLGRQWGRGEDDAIRERASASACRRRVPREGDRARNVLQLFAVVLPERPFAVDEVLALVSLQEKAECTAVDVVRRPAAAARRRHRVGRRNPETAVPRRTDDRPRPAVAPAAVGRRARVPAKRGGTVVLTTHYMDEAQQLCDRIGIVDHGRRIALGTPQELIRTLGAEHFLELEAAGLWEQLGSEALRALPGVQAVERDGETRGC
jgi:ABC-2 type transport system ATP-binding protein